MIELMKQLCALPGPSGCEVKLHGIRRNDLSMQLLRQRDR